MAIKTKNYHPFITAGHDLFKSFKVILFCPEDKADLFTRNEFNV